MRSPPVVLADAFGRARAVALAETSPVRIERRDWGPAERTLTLVLVGLRWASLALMAFAILYTRHQLQRPGIAQVALAAAAVTTILVTWTARTSPWALLHPWVITGELTVGFLLQVGDGWAYWRAHAFEAAALGGLWPIAGVMASGIAWGWRRGLLAGVLLAAVRPLAAGFAPRRSYAPGPGLYAQFDVGPPRLLPALTAITLFALAGAGAGYLIALQRRARAEIADLQARQEVARSLHDGALQALAHIQRHAEDPEISRVARDAGTDLRAYLTTLAAAGRSDLRAALLQTAAHAERLLSCSLRVAVDEDLPDRPPEVVAALTGALTEAIANAAKHASPTQVTAYAGIADDGGIDVTVLDDGVGFDPNLTAPGRGIDSSIRARIDAIGGRVAIDARPGLGCEVQLWIP